MRAFLPTAAIVATSLAPLLGGSGAPAAGPTPDEQQLVDLMTEYYGALELYWDASNEYKSVEAYRQAISTGRLVDPNTHYIPKLLEIEAAHRGDDVGLLALWHVFKEAARGGEDDSPAVEGRREAVGRLSRYTGSELLPLAGKMALGGNHDSLVCDAVAGLAQSPEVPQRSRDLLRYYLAADDIGLYDARIANVKRLEALRDGAKPMFPDEQERRAGWLKKAPSAETMQTRYDAALATLEELAGDNASPVLPNPVGVDERWYVVRVEGNAEGRRLADRAEALLFKARHLHVGETVPDLETTLLDGDLWSMVDQRGKVVVLQFSFTGCGPCEEMYPDLADLSAQYGERLEVLTLMRDKTAEAALEKVAAGKLTWSMALDGKPGRLTQQWFVDGFPEVYVIDPKGIITAIGLRGEALREEVARLVNKQAGKINNP